MLVGLFVVLLLMLFLGTPVLLAIGAVGFVGMVIVGLDPALFPQKMFTRIDSFALLAMPYFILAGELMSKGGLSKKLVEFSETVVGHMRGGLGQSAVLANMVFANVSGSATASTAAIGSVLVHAMKERRYKPGFAASLLAVSGVIGSIIPPSMIMIVYGSMAGVSIGGLFLGGILPGLLITGGLMALIYGHSFLPGFPELRDTTGGFRIMEVFRSLPKLWSAVLAPVIVLGGIMTGIFTATEAGAIACIYAFIVAFFVYRSIKLRDLPKILVDAAVTTTMVVGVISVAGAFGWLLTYLDFNEQVKLILGGVSHNPRVVLLTLLGIMLVLTMFIESLAVLIILIPVIVGIGRQFGLDPLYLGMLVVLATQIGSVTPPVAVVLFVGTSIAGTTYDQTLRYCLPFILVLIAVLLLVFWFPWLATLIPHHFLG